MYILLRLLLITFNVIFFIYVYIKDCALKPTYLYVKMLIDWICKGNDDSPSIFIKKVLRFV